ncbi:putative Tripeptidyl-peptidase I [Verrucomicrobia bacterium]|nr:putative Tripeptidyl-peptidase I [Verrucomicrobiota bacterium]
MRAINTIFGITPRILPSGNALALAGLLVLTAASARGAERQVVPRHLPAAVKSLPPVGRLEADRRVSFVIGLPLRNQDELNQLIEDLYNPASPRYHQYLSAEQFTERFGPAPEDYQAVVSFANSDGLKVIGTQPNRMFVDVSGSVADIERAFQVTLRTYQHPRESRTFFAPDKDPTLDLAVPVLLIGGLDNLILPRPLYRKGVPPGQGANTNVLSGSGPSGTYMGKDFRAAYAPGVTLDGTGQVLGLLEGDGYFLNDITNYEGQAKLPRVPMTNVLVDGFNGIATVGDGANDEVALDIDMAVAMAPGLAQLIVYEADLLSATTTTAYDNLVYDLLNRMAADNLAKQMSSSWVIDEDSLKSQIYQQFATQGQSFFQACGDDGAYYSGIGQWEDSTNVTLVGGTTLSTTGPGGAWSSETVWNWWPTGTAAATGGGISLINTPIPGYQQGISMATNGGSTSYRNVPDVALTADNVYVISDNGLEGGVGGTSCAAPLWAGFAALVNQQSLQTGGNTVGFLNPAIYAIGKRNNYAYTFHDITTGSNTNPSSPSRFFARPGYDLCTGWGTPKGAALINALAPPDVLVIVPSGGFTSTGYVGGPFSVLSESFSLTNSGAASLSWAAGTTSSWLQVSTVAGTLTPGGAAASVVVSLNAAASNLLAGSYSGTVWITNLTDAVVQSRQFTLELQDDLQILPAAGVSFTRTIYGSFGTTNQSFTLTNAGGGGALSWGAGNTSVWLNVTPSSGVIPPGGSAAVTASLTPAALTLGLGAYSNTFWFTNLTDNFVASRPVSISVTPLIINGDFETGDFTGWTLSGNTNVMQVTTNTFYVHSGSYGAALGSDGSLGFLSQNVPTMPGARYTLSLWFRSDGMITNQFQIIWNSSILYNAMNLPLGSWTNFQFTVTAISTNSVLKVGSRDDPFFLALDDVSLVPDALQITPTTAIVSTGYVGGPFTITNQVYVLTNLGSSPLTWGLANTSTWLNASSSGGVLAVGAGADVTLSLTAAAASLPAGNFNTTVLFTNLSNGEVQSRQFSLQLQPPPEPLQIAPLASLVFTRPLGGSFSPASQNFVLTNVWVSPLNWSLASTSVWFSALPASGPLTPGGAPASVSVTLSGAAAGLPFGNYTNTVWFTNLTDGTVQSRQVVLVTMPLVENGGFETGDFSFWTETGNFGDCIVSTSPLYAHSGVYGASMGPSGVQSYLSQTLATTTGQAYILSCWLDSPDGQGPNEFSAAWNGSTLFDQTDIGAIGWTNLQFLVVATSSSTVIQFGFRDDPSYLGFDDVSVTAVAPPAFQSVSRAGNAFLFSWSALPGLTYQVQYATKLKPSNWTNLGGTITATNSSVQLSDPIAPGGNSMRFYRVFLVP